MDKPTPPPDGAPKRPASGAGGGSAAGTGAPVQVFGKRRSSRSMVKYIKPTLWGLLVLYVVLFLFANRDTTEVNFLFFSAEAPLVIALLVVFALGLVIGGGAVLLHSRKPDKPAKGKK
jgi:uncharacterized integral membrane protein